MNALKYVELTLTRIELLPDSVSGNIRKALVIGHAGARATRIGVVAGVVRAVVEPATGW